MTLLDDPVVAPPDATGDEANLEAFDADGLGGAGGAEGAETEERAVRAPLVVVAGVLASSSAAWMATRLFRGGLLPFVLALTGVAIGAGAVLLSSRFNRSSVLQYLGLPVGAVVGAAAATAAAGPGTSLPRLVSDALQGGGLLQPPIPFDPGWRFIAVVLFTVVAAGGCSLGIGLGRPKLALALPFPIALGAALLQPKGSELVNSAVAIVLLVGALAVAYGADLASEGVVGGGFEVRRLVRGAALLTAAVVGLVAVAQTDFLFPDTKTDEVIPPQKPPSPPPEPDRELFRVESDRKGPWRIGVLDVYDDNGFMLPSVDPARVRPVPESGVLAPVRGETYTATFTVVSMKGQTLLAPANQRRVRGVDADLTYDPRTQLARLVETSLPRNFTYTVEAPVEPDAATFAASPPPAPAMLEFTTMPAPPPGVAALLVQADAVAKNPFDRLQFVRQALYSKVVAAGSGRAIDVPPSRVDDLLAGGEGTPYEITAAEVMLARWAGVPARVGFGFYGGESTRAGVSFRPRHGAAWLEAYFEGSGWIPILGTPPKAKASISDEEKKNDPTVLPTDELALTVHVPVRLTSVQLLYEQVRYYLSLAVPVLALIALGVFGHPAAFKAVRSRRRRRWARQRGPRARVVVAYTELRDRCLDLNIGAPTDSPLQLLAAVGDDDEHAELAWLVTRAVWGDLRRDLRLEDVEAAERMARSVLRRIDRGQTGTNRLLAWTSRASLRDPWTREVPNAWPQRSGRRSALAWLRLPFVRLRRTRAATAAAAVAAVFLLGACAPGPAPAEAPVAYPDPLLPPTVLGMPVERQPHVEGEYDKPGRAGLVEEGRVFTVRDGGTVQGSIQVAVLKADVNGRSRDVQEGVERGLGSAGGFRTVRFGTVRLRVLDTAEQRVFLWFPPDRNVMELFVMRKTFANADEFVLEVIRHQRTASKGAAEPPDAAPTTTTSTVVAFDTSSVTAGVRP